MQTTLPDIFTLFLSHMGNAQVMLRKGDSHIKMSLQDEYFLSDYSAYTVILRLTGYHTMEIARVLQ